MNSGPRPEPGGAPEITARFDEDEDAWVFGSLPDGPAGSVIVDLAQGVSITLDRADRRHFFLLVQPGLGSQAATHESARIVSQLVGEHAVHVLESRSTAERRILVDPRCDSFRDRVWRFGLLQDLEAEHLAREGTALWWERERAALAAQLSTVCPGLDGDPSLRFVSDLPAAIQTSLREDGRITAGDVGEAIDASDAAEVFDRLGSLLNKDALGMPSSERCLSLGLLDDATPAGPARSQLSDSIKSLEQTLSPEGDGSPESQFRVRLDPALRRDGIVSSHGARIVWNRELAELTVNVVRAADAVDEPRRLWCRVFDAVAEWPGNAVPAALAPFVADGSSLVARLKLPSGAQLKNLEIEVTGDTTQVSRSVSASRFARTIALARRALKAERFSLPTVAAHLWEEAALEWHKGRDWRRCGLALVYAARNLAGYDWNRVDDLNQEAMHLLDEDAFEHASTRAPQGLPFVGELERLGLLDPDLSWPSERSRDSNVELDAMIQGNRSPRFIAGVDVGHYGVRVALAEETGTIVSGLHREAVDADHDFVATLDQVASLLREVLDEHDLSARQLTTLGVGIPAPVEPDKGMLLGNSFLGEWPLDEDLRVSVSQFLALERHLNHAVTVHLDNDANLCALGEFRRGHGRGGIYESMLFVKASAGIGAGVIKDGNLVRGDDSSGGEMGHFPLLEFLLVKKDREERDRSLDCPRCKQNGCLEMMASAPALERLVRENPDNPYEEEDLTFRKIIDDAREQDPNSVACKAVKRCGEYLGLVLAGTVNLMPPQLIVIGGAFSAAGDCFFKPIQNVVARTTPGLHHNTRIFPARDWEWAGVWGAIEMVVDRTSGPPPPGTESRVQTEEWEGVVLEVEKTSFLARVADLVGGAQDQEVEFSMSEVASTEVARVVPGAPFSWKVETTQESLGRRTRRSTLFFFKLPPANPRQQLADIQIAEQAKATFEDG